MLSHSDALTLEKSQVPFSQPTQSIVLRLATTQAEIHAAQRLRYKTFYQEFGVVPPPHILAEERDHDEYDPHADHLIVIDESIANLDDRIVGTYRLFRRENLPDKFDFFTTREFDISKLKENGGKLLELGRSCVLPEYRTKYVVQKLWQGIAEYVSLHKIDSIFGVASFHEENPATILEHLAYLHHFHPCPENLRPAATPDCASQLIFPDKTSLDVKRIFLELPPLIKGYLRVGSLVGQGAYKDTSLGHIDVCIVLPTQNITSKYAKHFDIKITEKESK